MQVILEEAYFTQMFRGFTYPDLLIVETLKMTYKVQKYNGEGAGNLNSMIIRIIAFGMRRDFIKIFFYRFTSNKIVYVMGIDNVLYCYYGNW